MTVSTVLFALIGISFLALVARACGVMLREERWLPCEIAGGELMFSERVFNGGADRPIVARVDRVYVFNGQLHLVELKVRRGRRVYETDIIELSAQRDAVAASTGMDVSLTGFIVIKHPDSHQRTLLTVDLLNDDQVTELVARRRAILGGTERPKETCAKMRCAQCEYRGECRGTSGFKVVLFVRSFRHQADG